MLIYLHLSSEPLRAAHEPHGGVFTILLYLYPQAPRRNQSPPSETK